MADETQEPIAPALEGDETAADIKTTYSRATSREVTSYLNRDHAIIKKLLMANMTGGGSSSGVGRIVTGFDPSVGRPVPSEDALFQVHLPNGAYQFPDGVEVIDEVAGYAVANVPPNMTPGKFVYLSRVQDGGVQVLAGNCLAPVNGKPPANAPNLPSIGLVTTDAEGVVSINPLYADEIMSPNKLLILHRLLQAQVESLSSVGGEEGEEGGGGGLGGASRADLLPWSAEELEVMTNTKVMSLIDGLRAELKEYVDSGRTKPMATDNDHFVSLMLTIYAEVSRLSPGVTDLAEVAMVNVGFAGHSLSGDPDDPGINATRNDLLYTTLNVDTLNRTLRPGS